MAGHLEYRRRASWCQDEKLENIEVRLGSISENAGMSCAPGFLRKSHSPMTLSLVGKSPNHTPQRPTEEGSLEVRYPIAQNFHPSCLWFCGTFSYRLSKEGCAQLEKDAGVCRSAWGRWLERGAYSQAFAALSVGCSPQNVIIDSNAIAIKNSSNPVVHERGLGVGEICQIVDCPRRRQV